MFDQTTPKGRILAAALDCAARKSWADVTLLDIAEAAKLPLGGCAASLSSKTDIIAALLRAVDDEVLKRAPKRGEGQEPRDVLFDIVMTRFDVLAPYKAALKSIMPRRRGRPAPARALLSSQHWMLQAAGIGTDGADGRPARYRPRHRLRWRVPRLARRRRSGPRPHHGGARPPAAPRRALAQQRRAGRLSAAARRHRRPELPALACCAGGPRRSRAPAPTPAPRPARV